MSWLLVGMVVVGAMNEAVQLDERSLGSSTECNTITCPVDFS